MVAHPHYLLGPGYQAGGVWFYPDESYSAVQTGIAAVDAGRHDPLTADGEAYDPTAMAAAHQTLQLPAIARVTNLETGRQVVLRLNDRGPANPARLIALTPRAAALLGVTEAARIRLEVLPAESHAAVDGVGGGPTIAVAAAPRSAITAENLPPPGGGGPGVARRIGTQDAPVAPAAAGAIARLPETMTQVPPAPGVLMLALGVFSNAGPAGAQAARVPGASVAAERRGRSTTYTVTAGPYATIPEADAALDRALRAGVVDARIVVSP